MSKIKKMLALIASLSIAMTSLAVIPAQAAVADGVTTIIEEDFSEEPKGIIGDDNNVYVPTGQEYLYFEGAGGGNAAKTTYTVDLGDKKSGMLAISFDVNVAANAAYYFRVFDRDTAGDLANNQITGFAIHKFAGKYFFDNMIHNNEAAARYSKDPQKTYAKQLALNTNYTIDMLLDLDNWTVQTYINGNVIYNGKMGMNEYNGSSTNQPIRHNANKFVIYAPAGAADMKIDNLAIYHYQDEWSKPVNGKEKRVLVSDNFEMPAGRPTHEYRIQKAIPVEAENAASNTYTEGVLTKGFEVVDDPINTDNKVLKFIHTKSNWSNGAMYRLNKLIVNDGAAYANAGSLEVTSGQIEVSYKMYTEIGNVYTRLWGTDYSGNGELQNYMSSGKYVMGQYRGNTDDKDVQNTYDDVKTNVWNDIRMVIDLDNEKISYYTNGVLRRTDSLLTNVTKEVTTTNTDGSTTTTVRHPFDMGLKVLEFANYNTAGVAYFDDIRVSVLEDVAVTTNQLKKTDSNESATISTVEDFMAQANPNYAITVYNSTDTAADMMLVMAVYNSDGRVEKVDLVQAEAAALDTNGAKGKTTRITTGFSDEFRAAVAQGKTIKLFVWDGVDTLTPITDTMTVN